MKITEKVSYIKGLAEGLSLDEKTAEGKVLSAIIDALEDIAKAVSDLKEDTEYLDSYIEEIDEDLGALEEDYYEEGGCCCEDEDDCDCCDCDDDFVFDNEMLALIFYKGFAIGQISCPTKYFPDASSINFMRSCKYGLGVLKTSILFALAKSGIYKSKIFRNDAKTLDKNEELPYFQG